ncbi:hypothetical protein [Amycolatopsis sp. RTGN1]|uniref:hypothetical protein n=1 Tax=Amycolatopsis ponsaeliensis TaxID=2992142 RepID=UPI00254E05ED|nr:hypothetical protein [Amycolatopsis sp. RTGN1]
MPSDPLNPTRHAETFPEFRRNLDQLTRTYAAARRRGRSSDNATLDLLQVLHREDRSWTVVHLAFAIAALAHDRTPTSAFTTIACLPCVRSRRAGAPSLHGRCLH